MPETKYLKIISKSAILVLFGIFISKILSYAYRIIVARTEMIGPAGYGTLSLGIAFYGILSTISLMGLNQGVLRYVAYYKAKNQMQEINNIIKSSIKISLILSLIISLALFLLSDYIAIKLFNNNQLGIVLKIICLAIPIDNIKNILISVTKGFQTIKYEIYSKNLVETISKIIIVIILIQLGFGLVGATIAYSAALFFSLISIYYLIRKNMPEILKSSKQSRFNKQLLNYSWPLLVYGVLIMIMGWTDTFMIGYLTKNATSVGIYNAALPIAQLMYIIPYALLILLVPILTETYINKDKENFKSIYQITNKWILYINSLLLIIMLVFPREIINLLFGDSYVSGAISMTVLAFGYYLSFSIKTAESIILTLKKTRLILLSSIIVIIVNILLNIYLIPLYNINGAAIATAISYILLGILGGIWAYKLTKINPFKKSYIKIIISMIATTILVYFIKTLTINLILLLIITTIIYSGILLILKSFEEDEIKILKIILKKIRLKV